jgi:hypothetical protein
VARSAERREKDNGYREREKERIKKQESRNKKKRRIEREERKEVDEKMSRWVDGATAHRNPMVLSHLWYDSVFVIN